VPRTDPRAPDDTLQKAVHATVSSLLRAGYGRAETAEAIRGFVLNVLTSASVPEAVVDAMVADTRKWVQGRLYAGMR